VGALVLLGPHGLRGVPTVWVRTRTVMRPAELRRMLAPSSAGGGVLVLIFVFIINGGTHTARQLHRIQRP
jgi:hypothetical protein